MRPFSDQRTSSGRPYDEQPRSRGCPQNQFTDHHLTIFDVLWTSVCCLQYHRCVSYSGPSRPGPAGDTNPIYKFPGFSLFFLLQSHSLRSKTDYKKFAYIYFAAKITINISRSRSTVSSRPLEFEKSLLELTGLFPYVFQQHFQITFVFSDRDFFGPFSLFSLCSGDPDKAV